MLVELVLVVVLRLVELFAYTFCRLIAGGPVSTARSGELPEAAALLAQILFRLPQALTAQRRFCFRMLGCQGDFRLLL